MRGQVKMMVVSMKVCFERGLGAKVTRLKKKKKKSLWDKYCDVCSLISRHCCMYEHAYVYACVRVCVCMCACACATGLFDVVVLVHFKGEALMRILQNSRGREGVIARRGGV